jgi:hypothetical protein
LYNLIEGSLETTLCGFFRLVPGHHFQVEGIIYRHTFCVYSIRKEITPMKMKKEIRLKQLQSYLVETKLLNDSYKKSSQAIPDPALLTRLLESHDRIVELEIQIAKLKDQVATAKL